MEAAAEALQLEAADAPKLERVRVAVRCRPLSAAELAKSSERVLEIKEEESSILLLGPRGAPKEFTFDAVYGENATQAEVYRDLASDIVESVMEGFNGTIFAYGQTGTGKTYTMFGGEGEEKGITPRAFSAIFNSIQEASDKTFLVRASFLELYNEEFRDLLSPNPNAKLNLRDSAESGVYAEGLQAFAVRSAEELEKLLATGLRNRKVGATLMNSVSSRSHSIFTLAVESEDAEGTVRVGKLNLVDLAGSERQSKAGSVGERFKEATKINLSLSALGNVISSLAEEAPFVPYRDSKLTRILQASLGGNTRTAMVAAVVAAAAQQEETLSTLRFGSRVKKVENKPRRNKGFCEAAITLLQQQIAQLRQQLQHAEQARQLALQRSAEAANGEEMKKKIIEVEEEMKKKIIKNEEELKMKIIKNEEEMKRKLIKNEEEFKIQIQNAREEERKKGEAKSLEMQNHLRQEFEQQKHEIEKARRKAEEELKAKELEAQQFEQHRAELAAQLQAMETQLLRGKAEVKRAQQQQQELKRTQLKLEEQMKMEEQLRLERDKGLETCLFLETLVSDRAAQLKSLSNEFELLNEKFNLKENGFSKLQNKYQKDTQTLLQQVHQLQVQLRLEQTINRGFVPPEEDATHPRSCSERLLY